MREGIEKGDWISVEDGTPCFGDTVEVKQSDGDYSHSFAWWNRDEDGPYWHHMHGAWSGTVTHWRPIAR